MRVIKITVWVVAVCSAFSVSAQNKTYPAKNPLPPKIQSQTVLLAESVVKTQWMHTLNLVNAPQNVTLLNPGHCIRVGIVSTGDTRDNYLGKTTLSFRVEFAGHREAHAPAAPAEIKRVKPEGGDFVAGALRAAGVNQPEETKTMASLGASADHWCAPIDAGDGTATVTTEVEAPDSHQTLNVATAQIESFETGSKRTFQNAEELGTFIQTYYRQPNPARLLPALQFFVEDQTQRSRKDQTEILAAFVSAALRSDQIAAEDFRSRISVQPPMIRTLGLMVLRSAGYDIGGVLNTLSKEEQQKFQSLPPLQDPFDLEPTQNLFHHLDMMWATFGATGQFRPVQTIASVLGWRSDYEAFDKLRKSPQRPSALTPSIVRGIAYTAAGWSLASFQRNDPLVADYIDYLLASPDTTDPVKSELTGLATNPAFKRAGGQ